MSNLKPWMDGPAELLAHAERHLRRGGELDLRIALVGFDNSIEVTVTTYLNLHQWQRNGRSYEGKDVATWLVSYNPRLDFLEAEAAGRGVDLASPKDEMLYYHRVRNQQYHSDLVGVPPQRAIRGIRDAALWTFAFLFEVTDTASLADELLSQFFSPEKPEVERRDEIDNFLDESYGFVEVAGQTYRTSDLLAAIDPVAYRSASDDLDEEGATPDAEAPATAVG